MNAPVVLLATAHRWLGPARLAVALAREGCVVDVVCPPGHDVRHTHAARRIYSYRALAPRRSLRAAVEGGQPDFIVPCDDASTIQLHRLHADAAGDADGGLKVQRLLERSLGSAASFPVIEHRAALMARARDLGIRAPETASIGSAEQLASWVAANGLPAVLKADTTSGGVGVRSVRTLEEATRAMAALSAPPSLARAVKRALVNRDHNYLVPFARRSRSSISVQRFIAGRDANSTVCCWEGEVLAHLAVEVLETLGANGPSTVVRVIENAEMLGAAQKIVRELKLSGLVGFDFVLQDSTGDAYLIELNPRATQLHHLSFGPKRDPAGSLCRAVSGDKIAHSLSPIVDRDVVALFPQEWLRDPRSPFLTTAYHDVPWEHPDLVRASLREPARLKIFTALSNVMSSVRRDASSEERKGPVSPSRGPDAFRHELLGSENRE